MRDGSFAARLNPDRVVKMLKICTAKEIQSFRSAFLSIYHTGNIKEFLSGDKHSIDELLDKIKELEDYDNFDKIQKVQIRFFVENLTMISNKLK